MVRSFVRSLLTTCQPDSIGNILLSPIGNQISCFDLVKNTSNTLPFENRKNIAKLALSPTDSLLISIDEDGRAILINFHRNVLLAHHNFKEKVLDCKFSPNGKLVAVTHGKHVQIWHAPGHTKEFAPFVLFKELPGHFDDVVSITWSKDSEFILTASKDMTARLYPINNSTTSGGACLSGHNDAVIGAWFSSDESLIYTISKDGALFEWINKNNATQTEIEQEGELKMMPRKKLRDDADQDQKQRKVVQRWKSRNKFYFQQNHAKVVSAAFHPKTGLLSVGFDSGIFGIWEMPDFANIQTLSISQNKINSVAINESGEWLAFGSSALGQLLVWEWQSESYVLKQQGHQHAMTCLDYSHDGQYIATGGDDGKVKIWSTQSGFCFVTFADHKGPVKSLAFARKKQLVFSCSFDGTIRAYDLIRYRNFRTFTSPTPEQFKTVAVDASGELVCAAAVDSFDVYVWSVQTGKLLEILSGHQAPISSLLFSPSTGQLASGSWDKTVRIWDIYARDNSSEVIELIYEVLALSFSPNGEVLVTSTLDGTLNFWSMDGSALIGSIEGRKDISGGRSNRDGITAANAAAGKSFTSVCFTSDGRGVLAGGNSKFVCLYDINSKSLLKKFQISHNLSLDRMQEKLNSKNMTEAGPRDMIDQDGELSDLEDRMDKSLPGVQTGDASLRSTKPEAKSHQVLFSPTGRSWAAACTQGLIIYSVDDTIHFDPFDLDMDVTPNSTMEYLAKTEYSRALISSFRLGEVELVDKVYLSIPNNAIPLVVRDIGEKYFERFLKMIQRQFESNPRIEFHLEWINNFFKIYTRPLKDKCLEYRPILRAILKSLTNFNNDFSSLCGENIYSLKYLQTQFSDLPKLDALDVNGKLLVDGEDVEMDDLGF